MLPPSLREWVREDHLVFFISDVVDSLNPSAILLPYDKDELRVARAIIRPCSPSERVGNCMAQALGNYVALDTPRGSPRVRMEAWPRAAAEGANKNDPYRGLDSGWPSHGRGNKEADAGNRTPDLLITSETFSCSFLAFHSLKLHVPYTQISTR